MTSELERKNNTIGRPDAALRRLVTLWCCFDVVGVRGFEPRASWSRTKRATICATPRRLFMPILDSFYIIITLRSLVKPNIAQL